MLFRSKRITGLRLMVLNRQVDGRDLPWGTAGIRGAAAPAAVWLDQGFCSITTLAVQRGGGRMHWQRGMGRSGNLPLQVREGLQQSAEVWVRRHQETFWAPITGLPPLRITEVELLKYARVSPCRETCAAQPDISGLS